MQALNSYLRAAETRIENGSIAASQRAMVSQLPRDGTVSIEPSPNFSLCDAACYLALDN